MGSDTATSDAMSDPVTVDIVTRSKDASYQHSHAFDQDDSKLGEVIDNNIPMRYRGTEGDRKDMVVLGKKQVLRRNFKLLTMTGFASMVRKDFAGTRTGFEADRLCRLSAPGKASYLYSRSS